VKAFDVRFRALTLTADVERFASVVVVVRGVGWTPVAGNRAVGERLLDEVLCGGGAGEELTAGVHTPGTFLKFQVS
jgi:hypothetical protein